MTPDRLKHRADFVRAARGRRVHVAAFTLQVGRAPVAGATSAERAPRIGFTVTKKVGNAVVRNRIRRRLREAVRLSETLPTHPETDYVVVARREALSIPFGRLIADLDSSVRRSARSPGPGPARKVPSTEAQ